MELDRLSPIIEGIFRDALKQKIYRYGIAGKGSGLADKISSGSLYNSIKVVDGEDYIGIEMEDYGKFVQSGRPKGKKGVPISALITWIKLNNITGKNKKGKRLKPEQLAFAIQKTIKKFGIPSQPGWWDVAFENMFNNKELEEELGDITLDFFGETLKDL